MSNRIALSNRRRIAVGGLCAASLTLAAVAGSAGIAAAQGTADGHRAASNLGASTGSGPGSGGGWSGGHQREPVIAPGTGSGPGRRPGPAHGRAWMVRGTVVADPAPTSSGFTLDVPGCSTPQAVVVTSSTRFDDPGRSGGPSAVAAGEHVLVLLDPNDSTLTAESVTVLLAQVSGTISWIGASSFVVTDPQGFLQTVDVSGTTTYAPSGTRLDTLAGGEVVDAFGTVDADNVSLDAVSVVVHPAPSGTVPAWPPGHHDLVVGVVAQAPAPTSSGFTVDETGSRTEAVTTDASTKYQENGTTVVRAGVTAGEHVAVELVPFTTPPTAQRVTIVLDQLDGTIVSVGTTSLVVMGHQGLWRTVDVSEGTVYSPSGTTLIMLKAGQHVAAFGTIDPDGTALDAQFVDVFERPAQNSSGLQAWQGGGSGCPVDPDSTGTSAGSAGSSAWIPGSGDGRGSGVDGGAVAFGTAGSVDTTADSFVVTEANGESVTVVTTSTTVFRQLGSSTTPTLATLATLVGSAGVRVVVLGTSGPGTEITATMVAIAPDGNPHPGKGLGASFAQGPGGGSDGRGLGGSGTGAALHAGEPSEGTGLGSRPDAGPGGSRTSAGGGFGSGPGGGPGGSGG